ncbi:hypothetical protein FACS189423_07100 [Bacteroidia bacterium]|nr:hypothetical protein FACS189423_07100 [Bacteroidia bacterium]
MKQYVDSSIEAYNTVKLLVVTGGECFTLGKDLDQIVQYAANKGLMVRVVTNGYWATTYEKAFARLKKLVDAGLQEFNVSTGDEHQKWVPYDNVIWAVAAALELNIVTVVNVETSKIAQFSVEKLKTDPRLEKYKPVFDEKLKIIAGVWLPFVKTTKEKFEAYAKEKDNPFIVSKNVNRCTNLFNSFHIYPTSHLYACCGLTIEYIPFLHLGSAKKHPLKFLYDYQFQDFLKIWLFTEGPRKILDFCLTKRNLPVVNTSDWHICQICIEIFKDKQNIALLQQNYQEVFSNVIFKYSMLKKRYSPLLNTNSHENEQKFN